MFAGVIERNAETISSLKLKEEVLFSLSNISSQHTEDRFIILLKERRIIVGFCFLSMHWERGGQMTRWRTEDF